MATTPRHRRRTFISDDEDGAGAYTPKMNKTGGHTVAPSRTFEEMLWDKLKDYPGFFELINEIQPPKPASHATLAALKKADSHIKLRPDHDEKLEELRQVFEHYKTAKGKQYQLAGTDGSARTSTSSSALVTTSSFTTAPCSVYNAFELDPTSSDYVEPVYEWPTLEVMEANMTEPEERMRLYKELGLSQEELDEHRKRMMKRDDDSNSIDYIAMYRLMQTPNSVAPNNLDASRDGETINVPGSIDIGKTPERNNQRFTSTPKSAVAWAGFDSPKSSPINERSNRSCQTEQRTGGKIHNRGLSAAAAAEKLTHLDHMMWHRQKRTSLLVPVSASAKKAPPPPSSSSNCDGSKENNRSVGGGGGGGEQESSISLLNLALPLDDLSSDRVRICFDDTEKGNTLNQTGTASVDPNFDKQQQESGDGDQKKGKENGMAEEKIVHAETSVN